MAEPFYGAASPVWIGMPSAAGGWFQGPSAVAAPALGFTTGYSAGLPQAAVAGQAADLGLGTASASAQPLGVSTHQGVGLTPTLLATPSYTSLGGPELNVSVTAAALLTSVALRRGQPMGPTNDQEVEEFIFDALELLPGTNDIDARSESGRVTLTGNVQHKRLKRDAGEIAWAIPGVNDVQNNLTIVMRRRSRSAAREPEVVSAAAGRKQS